jgi:CubicO group peptidase (beta-lactamase class C family)
MAAMKITLRIFLLSATVSSNPLRATTAAPDRPAATQQAASLLAAEHTVGAATAPVDLHEVIAPIFEAAEIPGGAALVLRGNQIVALGVAGVRKRGSSEAIELDDKFHLGSCAKAMTATLVALLIEEGKLNWTTTLPEIFGTEIPNINDAWAGVTVQHILAHRAGMPSNTLLFLDAAARTSTEPLIAQRKALVSRVLAEPPLHAASTTFLYSNLGFAVAGAAAEKVMGRSWEELMRQRIFEPLGMKTAGFGAPASPEKIDQPWGHRGNAVQPVEPGPRADNPAVGGPAGRVHVAIRDWAKFIALHLRGDPLNPQHAVAMLSEQSFERLHRPGKGETYAGGWGTGMRPWAKGNREGDTGFTLWHSGSNTMWFCAVILAPEIDLAVLVATNAVHSRVPDACKRLHEELAGRFAASR